MKNNQSGSALVMVLLITTVLMICSANVWHTSFFATDITRKRQQAEQQFWATHGLMMYALAYVQQNFNDSVIQTPTPVKHSTDYWPCGDGRPYSGVVSYAIRDEKAVQVRAQLIAHGTTTPVCSLVCTVRYNPKAQQCVIDGWQREYA